MSEKPSQAEARIMLAKLAALHERCDKYEPWVVVREPHDHDDGTTHFTHVRTVGRDVSGAPVTIGIGSYLTPDLAELLVTARNNLPELIRLARLGVEVDA